MNKKYKLFLKMNFISLFFIAVSFISITMAWFAYSGLAKAETEINVKAWYIEFQKDNAPISSDVVITLDEIYPGMEPLSEKIDIKNMGDSDAQISYSITSARILDEQIDIANHEEGFLLDKLSHDYPFHINIGLSKSLAVKETGQSELDVSVSWPLDSGNDALDSTWGAEAFKFKAREDEKRKENPDYQPRAPLKITISIKAEQFNSSSDSLDPLYSTGSMLLYDPVANSRCTKLSDTCMKTYVVDRDNLVGDDTVALLPDPFKSLGSGTYAERTAIMNSITTNWKANYEELSMERVLTLISQDVVGTTVSRANLSESILGDMSKMSRVESTLQDIVLKEGFITFASARFNYLSSSSCIWLKNEYGLDKAFSIKKDGDLKTNLVGEDKNTTCNVIPVILVQKSILNE